MRAGRTELGSALEAAVDEIAEQALRALGSRSVEALAPETRQLVLDTHRMAARLVARWLISDAEVTAAETARMAELGALVDTLALDDLVKSHLAWRDAMLRALGEATNRLGTSLELVAEVRHLISRRADGGMVRMTRQFDGTRKRLEADLWVERAKLAHQAMHDALTGLPNRTLLFERVDRALLGAKRHGLSTALLFCDLDGFKAVNDRFGHEAGDVLLREVADRIRRVIRPSDTVARLGGDEFVVLCERLGDPGTPETIAQRIVDVLSRPYAVDGETLEISASVGIAATAAGGEEPAGDLLLRADVAMYEAKQAGRGRHAVSAGSLA